MWPAAGPRARNDLRYAVACHIRGRHRHTARKRRIVGEEVRDLLGPLHSACRRSGPRFRGAAGQLSC